MGMMQEFKEFAVKGNVIYLAVGVIIGGAFGKIVTSMVEDLIMPMVGAIFGNLDFTNFTLRWAKCPTARRPRWLHSRKRVCPHWPMATSSPWRSTSPS